MKRLKKKNKKKKKKKKKHIYIYISVIYSNNVWDKKYFERKVMMDFIKKTVEMKTNKLEDLDLTEMILELQLCANRGKK